MYIPMTIINAAAANIAIKFGARGMCTSVVTACATGTNSIGDAYRHIKDGYADIFCDPTKKCIVLITCLEENDDAQIVYIGYLSRVEPYENEE